MEVHAQYFRGIVEGNYPIAPCKNNMKLLIMTLCLFMSTFSASVSSYPPDKVHRAEGNPRSRPLLRLFQTEYNNLSYPNKSPWQCLYWSTFNHGAHHYHKNYTETAFVESNIFIYGNGEDDHITTSSSIVLNEHLPSQFVHVPIVDGGRFSSPK